MHESDTNTYAPIFSVARGAEENEPEEQPECQSGTRGPEQFRYQVGQHGIDHAVGKEVHAEEWRYSDGKLSNKYIVGCLTEVIRRIFGFAQKCACTLLYWAPVSIQNLVCCCVSDVLYETHNRWDAGFRNCNVLCS